MTQGRLLLLVLFAALGYCLTQLGFGQGFALGFLMVAILVTVCAMREQVHGAHLRALKAKHDELAVQSQARMDELDRLKDAVLAHIANTQPPHQD
ncbi:MAG: hypothetical protein VYB88_03410 [Pseudomonadota bacterium]|uniref:hypothetical protein n=1 Tax=Ralstonia pickettii TaxID=329 RepID=UPI0027152A42|nr:hypothetical protein [Ralstonia pickettii]MEE2976497.1 hypothetical protein [Pseudomonadota bacterium]WKZ86385.1 hypothetical protein N5B55_05365 [Ralstonia pickettii]